MKAKLCQAIFLGSIFSVVFPAWSMDAMKSTELKTPYMQARVKLRCQLERLREKLQKSEKVHLRDSDFIADVEGLIRENDLPSAFEKSYGKSVPEFVRIFSDAENPTKETVKIIEKYVGNGYEEESFFGYVIRNKKDWSNLKNDCDYIDEKIRDMNGKYLVNISGSEQRELVNHATRIYDERCSLEKNLHLATLAIELGNFDALHGMLAACFSSCPCSNREQELKKKLFSSEKNGVNIYKYANSLKGCKTSERQVKGKKALAVIFQFLLEKFPVEMVERETEKENKNYRYRSCNYYGQNWQKEPRYIKEKKRYHGFYAINRILDGSEWQIELMKQGIERYQKAK